MERTAAVCVQDVVDRLEAWAPPALAEPWDNVGLQLGAARQPVRSILVTLDVDAAVAQQAAAEGVDLIVSHHPLIFDRLAHVRADDPMTATIVALIRAGVAVYCAHTNLDRARGGVNDALAGALRLQEVGVLERVAGDAPAGTGMGRVGLLEAPLPLQEFAARVQDALALPHIRWAGNAGRLCRRVAVCGGAGAGMIEDALRQGCDVLVTGDVKYHQVQAAVAQGLAVIDADHFGTEHVILPVIQARLAEAFAGQGVRVAIAAAAERFRGFWQVGR